MRPSVWVPARAMAFVDGSNLLAELGAQLGTRVRTERPHALALSLAAATVQRMLPAVTHTQIGEVRFIRSYWFGSLQGDETYVATCRHELRRQGFEPVLFRKPKDGREKGVDLAVARETLIHAFNKHYEVGVLVAGDADYLDLVRDLKRLGVQVAGMFYEGKALSNELRTEFDLFVPLDGPAVVNATLAADAMNALSKT